MRQRSWRKKWAAACVSLAVAAGLLAAPAPEPVHADRGVVDLWKAIKPLTTIASAMNTGAHPDDEHSATLAYLSLGLGVNTSSVIANRGEGGQNEIGSELGDPLGVIRTRELEEASRVTNVTLRILSQDIGDPIYDFGFSKSPEETLQKWGESVVYERLIRTIRELRPDVLVPSFLNEPSTHGHHRAINILTVRAFADAGNPDVFPEHIRQGLKPWQPRKLYVPASEQDHTVAVPVGEYDEIYGGSYQQLGEESRFLHKSQGMGRHVPEGPGYSYYKLLKSVTPAQENEESFFAGIPFTFDDLAREVEAKGAEKSLVQLLHRLQDDAEAVVKAYPRFDLVAREVHEMKKDVEQAVARANASRLDDDTRADVLHRLHVKREQLNRASAEAVSLVTRVTVKDEQPVPGQSTEVTLTAYNGGRVKLTDVRLNLRVPDGWTVRPKGTARFAELGYNQTAQATFEVRVPADAAWFHPYRGSAITGEVEYEAFGTSSSVKAQPANAVGALPPFALSLNPAATVLNTLQPEKPLSVSVSVRNYTPGEAQTDVSLEAPEGWNVTPAAQRLAFSVKGETKSVTFTVQAPANTPQGTYAIRAVARSGPHVSDQSVQVIQYPHIGRTYFIQPAVLKVQAFDLRVPEGLKVGYVSSGFDEIDQVLRQVGVDVVNLEPQDIQFGDLSQYDTIVLGIRAYGFRPELIPNNPRLLDYVKNGGNLVVQYHKPEDKWSPELAPYPIKIGTPLIQWRVTDEHSRVTMLAPDHPMFRTPNVITEADWQNWIQDRAAYIPSEWGGEYTELISTGDPGEDEFAGTFLTANYGKGTYTYSALVWYREIPSLVPGAIRLFVNMISLKQ